MGIDELTLKDLQEFREVDSKDLAVGEFKARLRALRDKYNLTDHEALKAHSKAIKILPHPTQWT